MQPSWTVQIAGLLLLASITVASSTAPRGSSTAAATASTCHSGSVNYITASLPQQCATGSRLAPAVVVQASANSSSTVPTTLGAVTDQATAAEAHMLPTDVVVDTSSVSVTSSDTTSPVSSAATSTPEPASRQDDSMDGEVDSPLDNANFLSFEEWRKKNLAKAGQNPDHVGQQRSAEDMARRPRPGISNDFDVLGEESEIALDFSGFGTTGPTQEIKVGDVTRTARKTDDEVTPIDKLPSPQTVRSKDAGRTCKERTNYASFDCAATVLKTNPECKSASSLLVENKDSYMLNICKVQNKFFIVELCNDILIDTVVLANYEFFSSIFRTFRLSVSDRYPVKADKWRELGVYEARNTREVQAFLVEQPLIWARYLRVEILSHYGNEYYCPVSLLRVHGTTMMEEFRHQEDLARGDDVEGQALDETEVTGEEMPVKQEPEASSIAADKSATDFTSVVPTLISQEDMMIPTSSAEPTDITSESVSPGSLASTSVQTTNSSPITTTPANGTQDASIIILPGPDPSPSATVQDSAISANRSSSATQQAASSSTGVVVANATTTIRAESRQPQSVSVGTTVSHQAESSSKHVATTTTQANATQADHSVTASSSGISSSEHTKRPTSSSASDAPKRPSPIALHAPAPSTQESFFKSISKRLQALESNATLSLQYIEESSRILRDAFAKVEKRQVRKTETFLSTLNATVHSELQSFRSQYDLLWQSTIIELEHQRGQYQTEILTVTGRLDLLTGELLFQKRMVVVQSTLLIMCLAFVLFSRTGTGVEVGMLAQLVKSPTLRGTRAYSPPQLSPDARRDSPGWRSRLWRRSASPGTGDDAGGIDIRFQPATPMTRLCDDDVHDGSDDGDGGQSVASSDDDDHEGDAADVELSGHSAVPTIQTIEVPSLQTRSSPATPTGTRDAAGLLGHDGLVITAPIEHTPA